MGQPDDVFGTHPVICHFGFALDSSASPHCLRRAEIVLSPREERIAKSATFVSLGDRIVAISRRVSRGIPIRSPRCIRAIYQLRPKRRSSSRVNGSCTRCLCDLPVMQLSSDSANSLSPFLSLYFPQISNRSSFPNPKIFAIGTNVKRCIEIDLSI